MADDAPEPGAAPVDNEAGSDKKNEVADPNENEEHEELLTQKSKFGVNDTFDLE